ncbi:hypothetical protein GOODEAATRI_009002 [Goodea atripinnis]|uniref:Uncharacterized protein n=1 Tax=Goodea atripinnis TaxID=208336 RepID=A0ABV0NT15_9TELE
MWLQLDKESCFSYSKCELYLSFLRNGSSDRSGFKHVFAIITQGMHEGGFEIFSQSVVQLKCRYKKEPTDILFLDFSSSQKSGCSEPCKCILPTKPFHILSGYNQKLQCILILGIA